MSDRKIVLFDKLLNGSFNCAARYSRNHNQSGACHKWQSELRFFLKVLREADRIVEEQSLG